MELGLNNKYNFGELRLSVKGTSNGNGFDILYKFNKSHDFIEFKSKPEFLFIQPWMQFPSKEYSQECQLVSIELVKRFNQYPKLLAEKERLQKELKEAQNKIDGLLNRIDEIR